MTWDPAQYRKFGAQRLRPALDLLARVELAAPRRVADLGCGEGAATRLLRERWPAAELTGVDRSPEMLRAAARELPAVNWVEAAIESWSPATPVDLLYSNAALHWVGDHDELFPRLLREVAPGGVLAVQMPRNFDAPSHTALAEAVREGPWRAALEPLLRERPVAPAARYHEILAPEASGLDVWETEYLHVLEGENPVAEWTKGTLLRPLLAALREEERPAFEAEYRARVARAYPPDASGRTPFPFRRLFLVARRA